MVKIYSSDFFINRLIFYYSLSGYFLTVLLLLFNNHDTLNIIPGIVFLITTSILVNHGKFKKSPLAIPICFFTFIFLNIPTVYLFIQGNEYIFGNGLVGIPFTQKEYHNSIFYGFLFLTLCWFSIWYGSIVVDKISYKNKFYLRRYSITPFVLIIFAISILILHFNIHIESVNNLLNNDVVSQSKIGVLFSMHAFVTLAGTIAYLQLNFKEKITYKNEKSYKLAIGFIFVIFLFYQSYTGGKAAILQIMTMIFLVNIAMSREFEKTRIIFLSKKLFWLLLLLAPILYTVVLFKRISIGSGVAFEFSSIFFLIQEVEIQDIFHNIMLRLSSGGLDRYFLLFNSFILDSYSHIVAIDYSVYVSKNTINLVVPGTIFPEAYAPSGQLFSQVINKDVVGWSGGADQLLLLKSLNTSPYTGIGEAIVLFGLFAPFFLFIITATVLFIYFRVKNPIIKTAMIFLFFQAIPSFGIDGVIGDSFNLLISMFVIYFCMKAVDLFFTIHKK
jgi:hypothetical protein